MLTKISIFVKKNTKIILVSLIILLSVSLAFILGLEIGARFFQRPPILIKSEPLPITEESTTNGSFVASINGKYYYPIGCSYANRIKEENKIFFQSEAEAQSRGFKPWPGCF